MLLRLLWLIPLLPLAGFLLNGLLGARYLARRAVALVACAAVLASFAISVGAVLELHNFAPTPAETDAGSPARFTQTPLEWMRMGTTPACADRTGRAGS